MSKKISELTAANALSGSELFEITQDVSGTLESRKVTLTDVTAKVTGGYAKTADLFGGAYSDLTGAPTVPTNNNQLTNGSGYVTTDTTYTAGSGVSISGSNVISVTAGTAVADATATDDTATQLNALIASLEAAGLLTP